MPLRGVVVGVGGAVGATVRWAVDDLVELASWPYTLLIVNTIGSFLLGASLARGSGPQRELVRLGLGVGFCGGLTTYSGFAVASVRLLEDGRGPAAVTFVVASIALAAAAFVVGLRSRPAAAMA